MRRYKVAVVNTVMNIRIPKKYEEFPVQLNDCQLPYAAIS